MYAVAIAELSKTPGSHAELSAELGTTAYELRLWLNAGLPAVVLLTTDATLSARACQAIERHGHRPVSCNRADVVASASMTRIVDVGFGPRALTATTRADASLPYDDIGALIRGTHRTQTSTTVEEKSRKLRPGMALATGGLVMSKTIKRQVTTHAEQREQVLYLFRRSRAAPWILREREARYAGLGAALAPTSLKNFQTVTEWLRERAPGAAYDERLQAGRSVRGIADGTEATDLLAHLLVADRLALAASTP